jgi:hypothetical protein
MTIDSSWIACFKEEAPQAFTSHAPFLPDAVFIDGQIRLMPAGIEGVVSWEDYIQRQFERHLRRYFDKGVSCVILAFDDYAHVPCAKNMTQAKRRRNLPCLDFHARDVLPPCVPQGEDFTRCISNRNFKVKVIQLVIHRLTSGLQCSEGQCLVVDYCGPPVRYYARSLGRAPEAIPGLDRRLGEADVKFVPYTELFGKLQVDSVDGDTLPIALLHLERGYAGRLSVLRLQTRVKSEEPKKEAGTRVKSEEPKKEAGTRVKSEEPKREAGKGRAPGEESAGRAKTGRVYEYVDVSVLYEVLVHMVIPQCVGRMGSLGAHEGHAISMLACLVGLSGTDFTRGLPLVSGKSLYEYLPDLWGRLCRSYDPSTRQLVPDLAADLLVPRIYHCKFQKHAPDAGLAAVLEALKNSKLSDKTKERLPLAQVAHCTVLNVNWLLRYWHELSPPDPVQPDFGYVRLKSGQVQFAA